MLSRFSDVLQTAADVLAPPASRLEDFEYHWKLILHFYQNYDESSKVHIEETRIPHHLNQMIQLIIEEEKCTWEAPTSMGPCLEAVVQRQIGLLDALTALSATDRPPGARALALTTGTALLRRMKQPVLYNAGVLRPLQRMLVQCNENLASPTEREEVELLLTLCALVRRDPGLANIFASPFIEDKHSLLAIPEDIQKLIPITKSQTPKKNKLFEVDVPENPLRNVSIVRSKGSVGSSCTEDNGSCCHKNLYEQEEKFLLIDLLLSYLNSADNHVVLRACEGIMIVCSLPDQELAHLITSASPLCEVLIQRLCDTFRDIPLGIDPAHVEHLATTWGYISQEQCDLYKFPGSRELTSFFSWLDFCDTLVKESHPIVAGHLARTFRQGFLDTVQTYLLDVTENIHNVTENVQDVTKNAHNVTENVHDVTVNEQDFTKNIHNVTKNVQNVTKNVPDVIENVSRDVTDSVRNETGVASEVTCGDGVNKRVHSNSDFEENINVGACSIDRTVLVTAIVTKCLKVVDSNEFINEFSSWLVGDSEDSEWPLFLSLISNCLTHNHELTLATLKFFESMVEKPTELSLHRMVLCRMWSRCYVAPVADNDTLNDVSLSAERDRNRETMKQLQLEQQLHAQLSDLLGHDQQHDTTNGTNNQHDHDNYNIYKVINSWLLVLPRSLLVAPGDYEQYVTDAHQHYQAWLDITSTFKWMSDQSDSPYLDTASSTHSCDSRPEADIHVHTNTHTFTQQLVYKHQHTHSPTHTFNEGPFLRMLFELLSNLPNQPYQINLHLTSIFSKLAMIPHPNLHEYLLDPTLSLSPETPSLYKVLQALSKKLTLEVPRMKNYRKLLESTRYQLMSEDPSYDESGDHNQAIESVIVVEEFCKELAAIAFVKYQCSIQNWPL